MRGAAPSGPLLVTGGGESNELDRPSIFLAKHAGGRGRGAALGEYGGSSNSGYQWSSRGSSPPHPPFAHPRAVLSPFRIWRGIIGLLSAHPPPSRYGNNCGSRRRDLPRDWETQQAAGGYNFPTHRLKAVTPPCAVLVANPRNHVSGPYRCPELGCTAACLLFGGGRSWRGGRCRQSGGGAAATRRWIF